jgi:hypothetical protein
MSFLVAEQVANDFGRALSKARWRNLAAKLTRRSNGLLAFDDVRQRLRAQGQHFGGFRTVPIDQIVGSVSRYRDFDRAFLPRHAVTRHRWQSIDRAYYEDANLPAIELYQLGETYFVKDGNHRVSVAREQGQRFIDAWVIELHVPVAIGSLKDLETWVRKQDALDFIARTQLHDVEVTLCGQYEKLLEHIEGHRWFLGTERNACVPWAEAVRSWYDNVYCAVVKVVRDSGVLAEFPGRTEADLYIWLIEHQWFLRERGDDAPLRDVIQGFVSAFSPRWRWRWERLLQPREPAVCDAA